MLGEAEEEGEDAAEGGLRGGALRQVVDDGAVGVGEEGADEEALREAGAAEAGEEEPEEVEEAEVAVEVGGPEGAEAEEEGEALEEEEQLQGGPVAGPQPERLRIKLILII